MNLKEWTEAYIDYLNSYKKNLKSKIIKDNSIECEYFDKGKIHYIICEELDICNYVTNSVIVCLNTKQNLKFLIERWKNFTKHEKLKIVFTNPKLNRQWSIIPYIHQKYNDKKNLKNGLKSLFISIPEP